MISRYVRGLNRIGLFSALPTLELEQMPEPIRSAEKSRISTCTLADEVAKQIIRTLNTLRKQKKSESTQEVIAGIVANMNEERIHVLTIGLGNKFEPKGIRSDSALRDCHAEVLARRSFKLWLLEEFIKLKAGGSSDFFTFEENRLRKRDGIDFLLYISSCPCGNACIRRWGDSPKERLHASKQHLGLPMIPPHPIFHAHARHEGQIAVTYKGDSNILSCSDKILRWNVIGLQGTRLTEIVEEPIYLAGIIVGRKFVRKHAERAFCCRLTTKGVTKEVKENLCHPVLMCTSVKLDEGTFRTDEKECANFNHNSLWWMRDMDEAELLDGSNGRKIVDQSESRICKAQMQRKQKDSGVADPPEHALRLAELLNIELNKL